MSKTLAEAVEEFNAEDRSGYEAVITFADQDEDFEYIYITYYGNQTSIEFDDVDAFEVWAYDGGDHA